MTTDMPSRTDTSLILVRDGDGADAPVLLGTKKRGLGEGRIVAPGGKIDPGETPREAAQRELAEETSVQVDLENLTPAGVLDFAFMTGTNLRAYVFSTTRWSGQPQASDEISVEWYSPSSLPFRRAWPDNAIWLPYALRGALRSASFLYDADNHLVECDLQTGMGVSI